MKCPGCYGPETIYIAPRHSHYDYRWHYETRPIVHHAMLIPIRIHIRIFICVSICPVTRPAVDLTFLLRSGWVLYACRLLLLDIFSPPALCLLIFIVDCILESFVQWRAYNTPAFQVSFYPNPIQNPSGSRISQFLSWSPPLLDSLMRLTTFLCFFSVCICPPLSCT